MMKDRLQQPSQRLKLGFLLEFDNLKDNIFYFQGLA